MTLEAARTLEAADQVDAAYRAYLADGFVDDAARVLAAHGRAPEAIDLLLSTTARAPRPFDATTSARITRAIGLLEAQGQVARCLQALAWFGDQPLLTETADRIGLAGHSYDAGVTLARHGDPTRALAHLTRITRDDERYAAAAVEVIRALVRGARLTMPVDRFLAEFIRRGPADDAAADAFYALAAVYAKHTMPENALEVLERLCAKKPDHKDAGRQRRRLEEQVLGSTEELARVLDQDAAFEASVKRPSPPPPLLLTAPPVGVSSPSPAPGAMPLAISMAAIPAPLPVSMTSSSAPLKPPSREGSPAEQAARAIDAATAAATTAADDDLEAATTLSFAPGTTVSRRYKIIGVLGRGGMSIVYEAKDLELHETVALKLFTQPTNEEAIERFKQEIKLARQLIHENIIRVYDLGTALGARFLTMELLVGEDLHSKMTKGISLRDGCDLLAQACDGLEVAHRLGVVHRDIKPENLFVTKDNTLKVMDFGIAKQMTKPGLTMAGMVVGTPEYMAPEQAHGHMQVTPSADLYSIGIILYALATGQLPFRHDELVPLLLMHVGEAPRPPRQLNPGCPVEVERLILELLSKKAEQRPPSAAAVAERLRGLRRDGII